MLFLKIYTMEIYKHHNFNGINPGWYPSIAKYGNYMAAAFVDNHRVKILLFENFKLIDEAYLEGSDFRLYGFHEDEWKDGKPWNDGHHAPSIEFDKYGRLLVSCDEHHCSHDYPKDRHPDRIKGAPKLEWISTSPYKLNFKFVGHEFPGDGISYTKYRRCPRTGDLWMICRHHHFDYNWRITGFQGMGVYKFDYNTDKWVNFMGGKKSLFHNPEHGYMKDVDGELVDTNYQGYKGDIQIDEEGTVHICTIMSNHKDIPQGNSLMYAYLPIDERDFTVTEVLSRALDNTCSMAFDEEQVVSILVSNDGRAYGTPEKAYLYKISFLGATEKEITGHLLIPENLEINYYKGKQYISSYHPKSNVLIDNEPHYFPKHFPMMSVCNDTSDGLIFWSVVDGDLILNRM